MTGKIKKRKFNKRDDEHLEEKLIDEPDKLTIYVEMELYEYIVVTSNETTLQFYKLN